MEKNLNTVENNLVADSKKQEQKKNIFKLSWPLFKRSDFVIFTNGLKTIWKSKFFMIITQIFLAILIGAAAAFSQVDFLITYITKPFLVIFYGMIAMIFLLIFNIATLIRFFGEQKQNGIYSLEIRKGKKSLSIFSQRVLANKVFTFVYILLAIAIFYVFFAFVKDPVTRYTMVSLYAPGLWTLLVFDTFITGLIIFISLLNKIKLTASLASIISIIFIAFWIFGIVIDIALSMISPPKLRNDAEFASIGFSRQGQVTSHYAKEINQVRNKYKGGIVDSMIEGNSEFSSFGSLAETKWIPKKEDPSTSYPYIKRLNFEKLNTQLLFNGLLPDAEKLLSEVGVTEIKRLEGGSKLFTSTKYKPSTPIPNTYFNNFFTSKPNLFVKNGNGYSYNEWQKTIFNASTSSLSNLEINDDETIYIHDFAQKVGDSQAAINYLKEAFYDIRKNLVGKEKQEWNELEPIIFDAFKLVYINNNNRDIWGYSKLNYLNQQNFFNFKNQGIKFNFGSSIYLQRKMSNGVNYEEFDFSYPVFTVDPVIQKYQDRILTEMQSKIFKALTVKPGTRQLISIMASLVSNSILTPDILYIDRFPIKLEKFITNDENGNVIYNDKWVLDVTAKELDDFIHRTIKYNQSFNLKNPFKWIEGMFTHAKINPSFSDKFMIQNYEEINSSRYAFWNGLETYTYSNLEHFIANMNKRINEEEEGYLPDLIELINNDNIKAPNFDLQNIKVVKSSFSPLGALFGSLVANFAFIVLAYWIFKKTLIR